MAQAAKGRIVFLTCHLSGSGHLTRILCLAKAAMAEGYEALIISGGRPLDHIDTEGLEVRQLSPLIVRDLDFTTLRDANGDPASADYLVNRRAELTRQVQNTAPDVLVTELYPFGRRSLRTEFDAAIAAAGRAKVVCSIRDVPEPKPKRLDETAARLVAGFDAVLVHGEAEVIPLFETWPLPPAAARLVHHTGYLTSPPVRAASRGEEVLVAVGGGTLGRAALDLAARAAGHSMRPWHLLTAGPDAADQAGALKVAFPAANLTVEPARRDYPDLVAKATCSVSLCGYNTAIEVAQSQTPALFLPSEEGGEREQLIRAQAFQRSFGIPYERLDGLTPERLSAAVEAEIAAPAREPVGFADGGARALRVLETLLGRQP